MFQLSQQLFLFLLIKRNIYHIFEVGNNDKLQIAGKPVMERYYLVNAQNKERDNCIIILMSQVGNSLHADVGQDGCLQVREQSQSHSLRGGKTKV